MSNFTCSLITFQDSALGAIVQSKASNTRDAGNAVYSTAYCMDLHQLLKVAIANGHEVYLRQLLASINTNDFMKSSTDPIVVGLEIVEEDTNINSDTTSEDLETPAKETLETPVEEAPIEVKPRGILQLKPLEQQPVTALSVLKEMNNSLNWADISEETDEIEEKNAKLQQSINAKKKQLSWATRMKIGQISDEKEIDDWIDADKKAIEERVAAEKKENERIIAEAKKQEADAKALAKKQAEHYAKFHTKVPEKPVKKITNDDVKKTISDANDGFTEVKRSRKPAAKSSTKTKSVNKHPEKQKTTTSAKWFFFPGKPILPEAEDYNLWDYDVVKSQAVPIGWHNWHGNKYRIGHKSNLVHTRHPDGTWTHEEEIADPDTGKVRLESISAEYLRWILTPVHLRRGPCPSV